MPTPEWKTIKALFAGFHTPTIKNLLLLVEAIIEKRTTNLNKLKDALPRLLEGHSSAVASNYMRLVRFFKHKKRSLLIERILEANLSLLRPGRIRLIALDRTNWKLGSKNINLLTLGYLVQGVHIPLLWKQLDKQGNSNLEERKSLFERTLQLCHLHNAMLLADREFIGDKWFGYLLGHKIHFMIRLKADQYKKLINQSGLIRYSKLKKKALSGRKLAHTRIVIEGRTFYYVVMKNPQHDPHEPLLFFLTSRSTAVRSKRLQRYRQRWGIETFFRHLKTNGFNLEDISFKDDEKIELMMALTCLAYCLCIRQAWQQPSQAVTQKQYRSGECYRAVSVFRMGVAEFEKQIFCLRMLIQHLNKWLQNTERQMITQTV